MDKYVTSSCFTFFGWVLVELSMYVAGLGRWFFISTFHGWVLRGYSYGWVADGFFSIARLVHNIGSAIFNM